MRSSNEYSQSGGLSVNLYVIMIQLVVIQCVLINRKVYCTTCQLGIFITKNTMDLFVLNEALTK